MKLRNRDVNIFSMSALDLFASAMGAFMLLAVMALPFFPNTGNSPEKIDALKQQIAQAKAEAEKAKADAKKAQQESKSLKKQLQSAFKFALLGIGTNAESFVIVIDMSGSMQAYADIVIRTFDEIVEPFASSNKLQIIGYQGNSVAQAELHSWQHPHTMVSLTPGNKSNAKEYVARLSKNFRDGTPTWPALQEALKYNAEAIILFSDGNPASKPDEIIRDVTARNQGKKQIHTIAIGEYTKEPKLVRFLSTLAKNNDGGFIGVAR